MGGGGLKSLKQLLRNLWMALIEFLNNIETFYTCNLSTISNTRYYEGREISIVIDYLNNMYGS